MRQFTRVEDRPDLDKIVQEEFEKFAPLTCAVIRHCGTLNLEEATTAVTEVQVQDGDAAADPNRRQVIPLPITHSGPRYPDPDEVRKAAILVALKVEEKTREVFANSRIVVGMRPQLVASPTEAYPDGVRVAAIMVANCRPSGMEYM